MSYSVKVKGFFMKAHQYNLKRKVIISIIFTSIIFFGILQNLILLVSANGNDSLTLTASIELNEFSNKKGSLEEVTSLNIPLATSSWNITNINLNFSDIKGGREVKVIEDQLQGISQNRLRYKNSQFYCIGLSIQLTLESQTTIYGVFIYGAKGIDTIIDATFQIGGYDKYNHIPNGTVWRTTTLNMSDTLGWYYQNFSSSPITLPSGNYSLIMNGTALSGDLNYYDWYNIPYDPITPNLYSSEYTDETDDWVEKEINSTFLYKIDQIVNKSYNPVDINFTAQINGDQYQVLNGTNPGEGILSTPISGISPQSNQINIEFENNISTIVSFSVNYSISLQHIISSVGSIEISENLPNRWIFNVDINRSGFDTFETMINYSNLNWIDLSIFNETHNVTSPDFIDTVSKKITFKNESLTDEVTEWTIYAYSPRLSVDLNVPSTVFQLNQEIKFSIDNPIPGNYSFVLVDPLGFKIYSQTIVLPGDTNQFSYLLSSSSGEGTYDAYIFFSNGTHAGVQHQAFTITKPFDYILLINILITVFSVIFISIITGMTSYQVIKRYRKKNEKYRQKIFNMYMDVFNLNYFMVINKASGLNVYEQVLAGKEVDPTLISGFLQAIRTFGIELTDAEDHSQTIKLEFQDAKILMAEFRQFRLIFIMKENPSQDFINSIELLSRDIDEIYGQFIVDFKGDRQHFKGIRELLERNLNISLIYPLNVVDSGDIKLKPSEKNVVAKAISIMDQKNLNRFYVSYLMSDKKEFNVKTAEVILNLIHKKIFQPII